MYSFILSAHNILRWFVLIFAILAIIRAFMGWSGKRQWTGLDDKLGLGLTISLDTQVLLGLLLYFVFSPLTKVAFSDFGAAMGTSELRFFLVEHFLMMFIALVVAHIGRSRAKKADTDVAKHKRAAIFYTIALLLILAAIPWQYSSLLPF